MNAERKGRSTMAIAVLVVLWLTWLMPGAALAQGASLTASLGFDGTAYIGYWAPLVVDVSAGDQPVEGRISVRMNGNDGRPVEYTSPVSLAAGAKKRITMYVLPTQPQRGYELQLLSDQGRVLATHASAEIVAVPMGDRPIIGVLGTDNGSGAFLQPPISSIVLRDMESLRLGQHNFPERAEALNMFGLFVANDATLGSLSDAQRGALEQWVKQGGVLIVGTGPDGKDRTRALANLVPGIAQGGTKQIQAKTLLEEFAGKPVALNDPLVAAELTNAGEVLLEMDGVGLVYLAQAGTGQVYTAAFDLGLSPLTDWPGLVPMFDRLLDQNLPASIRTMWDRMAEMSVQMDYTFSNALGNIQAMKLPSIVWMLVMLLLYLVLAGPVSYLVLKKRDKREWMWLAVPMWSILFAVAIYGMGVATKGWEVISNTIGIVEMGKGNDRLHVYTGIFLPSRGDVGISLDTPALIFPQGEEYSTYDSGGRPAQLQSGAPGAQIVQDGGAAQLMLRDVPMWTMRSLRYEMPLEKGAGIDSELKIEDGKLTGHITNNTGWVIEDAAVYSSTGYQVLGTLSPGQVAQVDIVLVQQGMRGRQDVLWQMMDAVYPNAYNPDRPNWVRRDLMQNILQRGTMPGSAEGACWLVGFTQELTYPELLVNGTKPQQQQQLTMISTQLSVSEFNGQTLETMPGALRFVPQNTQAMNGKFDQQELYLQQGDYDLTLNLARYVRNYQIDSLELQSEMYYGSAQYQLKNHENGEYVTVMFPLVLTQETIARYLDGEGTISLRIAVGSQDANMAIPSATLKGKGR